MADPKSVGVSPDDNRDYLGIEFAYLPVLEFTQNRIPTTADRNFPIGQFWIVGKNPASGSQGDRFYLAYFTDTGDAIWFKDAPAGSGGGGNVASLSDSAGTIVTPNAGGNIQLDAGAGITVTSDAGNNKLTIALAGGGTAIDQIAVDATSGTGTNPVVSTAAGQVTFTGSAVANSSNPLRAVSSAVNTVDYEIQIATTAAPTPGDSTNVGAACFNSNQFTIDATSGLVSLIGGTVNPPVTSFTLDDTNAATADAAGDIDITGSVVANATNAKPLFTARNPASDDIDLQLQLGTTLSSAPADTNDAGIASFDDRYFSFISNGWVTATSGTSLGWQNLGFSLSSGVLTAHGYDGTALSASNPAYVTMRSKTAGRVVTIPITANQTINDQTSGAGSDMTNTLFGLATGNNWGSTTTGVNNNLIPLWIYAVVNDSENAVSFGLARVPHKNRTPSSAYIGTPGSPPASNYQDNVLLWNSVTKTEYDQNPTLLVGLASATFQQPGGADDWIFANVRSPGDYGYGTRFNFPQNVFGASANTWLTPNGGTAPEFTNGRYSYSFEQSGHVLLYFSMDSDPGTDGSGTVTSQLTCPYIPDIGGGLISFDYGYSRIQTPTFHVGASNTFVNGQNYMRFRRADTGALIQNINFANGVRTIAGSALITVYTGN